MDLHRCPKCKRSDIPTEQMGSNKARPSGVSVYCRACMRTEGKSRPKKPTPVFSAILCRHCGSSFTPVHVNQRFCSPWCRKTDETVRSKKRNTLRFQSDRERAYAYRRQWLANNPHKKVVLADYHAQRRILDVAKSDISFRRARDDRDAGFAFVAYITGNSRYYRAVPFGERLHIAERVVVNYYYDGKDWSANKPFIIAPEIADITRRIIRREQRR